MSASVSFSQMPFWHMQKPRKMSLVFHDPSICFNFLYFHRKVNMFKTPEKPLLQLGRLRWMFTIIFAGSFHYFKLVSCWILFCENVAGIPEPFGQLPSYMRKVNTFKHGAILYNEAEVFSLSITNPNGRPMLPFDWLIHSGRVLARCHKIMFFSIFFCS